MAGFGVGASWGSEDPEGGGSLDAQPPDAELALTSQALSVLQMLSRLLATCDPLALQ